MMRKSVWMMAVCGLAFGLWAEEPNPGSDYLRGHENIEWSIGYAFHLTDGRKNLPFTRDAPFSAFPVSRNRLYYW